MTRNPEQETVVVKQAATPANSAQVVNDPAVPDPEAAGPRPIGTLMVIAILLLVTLAFWMMVLGIQQGRA